MKKMWKRFVSLLLACTLLAGMLPLSASAAVSAPGEGSEQYQYAQGILNQLNNELGDGDSKFLLSPAAPLGGDSDLFTYVISRFYIDPVTNEGTTDMRYVIVPGVGASDTTMPNYSSAKDGQPWAKAAVSTFYIAKGVTGIGSYAFASQPSLNNVVFQDASDLTYIGQRAFYDDDNAVFTDEGNEDKTTTLDLSNVKKMGEYAFYNCDKLTGVELGGSITAVETVEGEVKETEYKIPSHAFTSTGVQSITVPSGITEVGEYAFYDCPLNKDPYISLQEGLKTIGNYAFGKNDAAPNKMMTSLTIPSSVESIGDHAFYNYTGLQTVTVLGKDNGGAKESVLDHVGDAAFGDADHNAYSTTTTIQDAVHPEIEYTGLVGTQFYLPKELEKNDNLFVNGETCYTGDITPMQYVGTEPADCINAGYDIYKTTFTGAASGGEPIVMTYHYPIPALGHDYGPITEVKRTCENDNYFVQFCERKNCPNKGVAVGSLRQNQEGPGLFDENTDEPLSDEELDEYRNQFEEAVGHNWKVKSVVNPNMQEQQTTTLYYVCENKDHSNSLDTYDSPFKIPLSGKTIHALTTQSLNDLTNQLAGFSNDGIVRWATPSNEKFGKEGERNEPVTFTIQTGVSEEWPVFTEAPVGEPNAATEGSEKLTVKINVTKDVLDLSGVSIVPNTANVNKPVEVRVSGFEEAEKTGSVEYYVDGTWTDTQPGTVGEYRVRVTFEYDKDMYNLPEKGSPEYPGTGYTLVQEEDSVWVEHSFEVSLNKINAVAESISNLTYNGEKQNTLRIYGLEIGQKAVVTTTDKDGTEIKWEYTRQEGDQTTPVEGLSLLSAGTYNVKVVFSFPGEDSYADKEQELTVHIDHKPVEKPVPTQNMSYLPVKTARDAFGGQTSADWQFVDDGTYTHTGINAGSYTAKVKLTSDNYRWADENEDVREIEIPWTISPRQIVAPTLASTYYIYEYGIWRNSLFLTATAHPNYEFVTNQEDHTVKLVFVGNKTDENYDPNAAVAYTAADAYHTNRDDYTVIVTLNNSGNYVWWNGAPQNLTWTIAPANLNLPKIEAEGADYTGEPYDAESLVTVKNDGVTLPGDVESEGYQYSNDATFRSPSSIAPTNAGTYYVRQNYTYDSRNYNAQIPFASFTITPAKATMKFDKEEVSAPYTTQGTDLQKVTVSGLVGKDAGKDEAVKKEVKYSYKYSKTEVEDWSTVANSISIKNPESQKFKEVGYYQITAKWGAGTVSNNYTATDATYTLTIKKAEDQSITLTPDEEGRWTEAINQTPAKYTITYGEAATFKVTGTAALDDADISYEVNGDSEVVSVNGSSGEVTIKQAGEATITVTAADTDNVGAASVEYTVTVNRAEPKLELNEGHAAYTGSEVAEDTYKKATLSGAGEGYAHPDGTKLAYYFYEYNANSQNTVLEDTENENALKTIPSSVGDYWLKVVFPGDACYSDAAAVAKFTITPAELSVSATGHTGTYDGKTHSAITIKSVTGNGTTLAQGQYTVKYAKTNTNIAPGADAGDDVWQDDLTVKDVADSSSDKLYYWYMVTADNYNPAIGKVEVKITPAPLTVTGEPASYEKEYDGDKEVDEALTDITVTAEDVPDVTISVAATGTYADKDAGTKKDVTLTLTLSGTDGTEIDWGNYSYNDQALTEGKITLTKAGAGTITPKAITVTGISAVNRVYDGTTKVQLTGTPETTEGSFIGKDDVSFSAISNQTGTVTDAKAEDGKTVTVAAETLKGLLTGEDAENYTVTQEYPTTVDITPRPVTLQFPNGNSSMTTSYDPNGLTSKPNVYKVSAVAPAEGTGFVSSDALADGDIQYTFKQDNKDVENPINVGEYTVTAELTDEAAKKWSNYTIEAITGTVEIIQATEELTVTVTEKTGLTYTGQGQDPIQSISVKGGNVTLSEDDGDYEVQFKLSEEGDYELDRDQLTAAVKDAKEYTVYWQVTTTNYGNKTDSFTVKVAPATLTLSSSLTKEKKYDGATEAVVTGQKVTGAQNNESITVSSVSAAYDDANVDTDKTITTTYTVTFGADVTPGNYTYTGNVEGKATSTWTIKTTVEDGKITQAPITVAINDQKKVYDGQSLSIENPVQDTHWSTTGTIYLQDGVKDDLGITLSIASGSKDAGTYAITGAASNQNYEVTFTGSWTGEDDKGKAGTYTISPRPINVQIGDAEGFYGDVPVLDNVELVDDTEDGVSDAGLVDGEVLKEVLTGLKLATTANAQSDISNEDTPYTIYAKNGEDPILAPTQLGNYKVTFTKEGTYTVKQRPITITIKDHSSVYGEKIDGGIADPVSDKDYTVAITNQATTGDAIVKGDNLEIKLTTKATADSPVDDYDITGSAEGNKVNNYAITWAGNGGARDDEQGQNGRYTIKPAQLDIAFTQGDQVTNGVSINITDSYNANPLVLKNASTNVAVSEADKATLDITYSIGAAGGGAGGVSQIAEIDETTGEVTIHSTGTVRITATVTPQGNSNYTGQVTTWYELNIISGGQMTLKVTPKTNLTYTGEPQALLESASCSLEGATIQYSLNNRDWGDEIPTGINAGNYTVYVKATDPSGQYSDVTEHVMVTISKAELEGAFKHGEKYTHVLATDGTSYDSANKNPLTITSKNYDAKPANYTYYSDNMQVASSANGTSTIVITGTAGESATIRVTVPGDDNYNGKTFTYTLEISEKLSEIKYSVENDKVTYNGQPQTIAVNVTAPASGATVRYWNESTNAYDQTEPPAYTDVQDSGTTIKFQITAPGYKTVTDEATLTIKPRDINLCQVEGIAESYTFVNKPIEPQTVEVVDGSVILTKNTDYTLEYGANQEVGEDTGTVIIKGTGNYTGEVIEHFDIIPVDGSSGITASIAPNFGTYDPDAPVTAEVTVTHQTGSESHNVDLTAANAEYTISATDLVTGQTITDHGATGTGGTLTFTKPAIYDITLTLTGDHRGEFHLSYTLLPLSNEDGGLTLTVDDETQKVFTYGDEIDSSGAAIKVTANNTDVTDQCTLTYVYTPFEGTPTTTASPYTAEVLENAGVYTVTATPTDGSAITGTGTFTFLILQRDLVEADLTVEDSGLVYNQNAQTPSVTVAVTGNPTADDYEVAYYNNVNASDEAKAVVTAKGNNFTGSQTAEFTIAPKEITADMVQDIPEQYYTGNEVIPPVTITDGNYTLILGYDYTTACEDKGPGEATVTITGIGNYTGTTTKDFVIKSEGAPEPSERFDLAVRPSQWTWGDDLKDLALNVTFGTGNELTLGKEYTLEVNGQTFDGTTGKTKDDALTYIKGLKPSEYTITATGVGAYNGSTDTETVTIQKIQPEVTVTATPNSLSGGGKVTLTLKGEKLPAFAEGQDLSSLLTASAKDEKNAPDLSELEWETDEQTGVMTAELTLPNTSETYTFTLTFTGNEYYEAATASEQVVVAQQIISGGGGGPVEDQPANPDDTGVSDWLNTKEHLAYLAGYPGGIFGPDQNMTRAEAAQMFYNLLLEKDVEITVEFEDVPADAWYATPVNTLASLGILSGVGDGQFDPERSITRAEFTVIAMKFANTSGGGVNIFSDVNEDDWFYSAVVDSTQYGWINGYPDGTFRPEATISRAEVTVIVNHMLGRAADRPYVIAHEEELNTFGDVNRGHWGYFHIAEATNAHEYHTEDGTESWTGLS